MTSPQLTDVLTEGINAVNDALREEFRDLLGVLADPWEQEWKSREVKP